MRNDLLAELVFSGMKYFTVVLPTALTLLLVIALYLKHGGIIAIISMTVLILLIFLNSVIAYFAIHAIWKNAKKN